ncbi:disulfide bond formation protein DsbB [Candidatus Schmidhempelia bombi]|jgi:protein dithiol:quinone oxidoreductase|uniref:Disulfide bond formation protein B n=1 Tax=Candidatus Schmidhempelia bombi str. Bimp TaxID=1387197 RepID=A0AB94IEK0_9GAMM|nr:disulfide bond formation protein DsbB [Candidatus Schmidhempelia bombi]TEA27918.1 disulfide bond formation protein DsbB [Candidatus Schmidhempelia bombi str. Bimp]
MLRLLNYYSQNRLAWFLLLLSALSFELVALFFQHVVGLLPCTLCIYQRCVFLGIMLAALIALINPKSLLYRLFALALWLYCAIKGFCYAYEQVTLQFQPSLFHSCSLTPEFPSWLPLDRWFPAIFASFGQCSEKVWAFLSLEMSQWTMLIFICYVIVALLILLVQFFKQPLDQNLNKVKFH